MTTEDTDVTGPAEAEPMPLPSSTPGPGLHRRLTLNSVANLSRYLFSILLSFFLTPFVVKTLGNSLY